MRCDRLTLGLLTLATTVLATACAPAPTDAAANVPAPRPAASVPATVTPTPTPAPAPAAASEPAAIAQTLPRSGTFASGEHATAGGVTLVTTGGQSKLVFDAAFTTANGPDLVVVLHRSATLLQETSPPAYPLNEGDYVVIAPLAATNGTQEYLIPAEVNVDAFQAVAVWCQAFNATFGAAALR
ncbi:MAG TPA: DM13 domain-containing protein [Candidatus Obscuribacterales bacterium]